jgi:hypothetical protein
MTWTMQGTATLYWFSENGKFAFGALAMRDKDTR